MLSHIDQCVAHLLGQLHTPYLVSSMFAHSNPEHVAVARSGDHTTLHQTRLAHCEPHYYHYTVILVIRG